MKKATIKDFEKEITSHRMKYLEDKHKYNWSYTDSLDVYNNNYHVFTIANTHVATVIKFDEQFNTLEISNISVPMINKIKELQNNLEGTF